MARKITDECISCGACEAECPNSAISQGDEHFEIDATKCDECASSGDAACLGICPIGDTAIVKR